MIFLHTVYWFDWVLFGVFGRFGAAGQYIQYNNLCLSVTIDSSNGSAQNSLPLPLDEQVQHFDTAPVTTTELNRKKTIISWKSWLCGWTERKKICFPLVYILNYKHSFQSFALIHTNTLILYIVTIHRIEFEWCVNCTHVKLISSAWSNAIQFTFFFQFT